jgi:hypothetical protein
MALKGGNELSQQDDNHQDSLWVKVGVIATVLGTVIAYVSLAAARDWPPFDSSSSSQTVTTPHPKPPIPSPTPNNAQVEAALLQPVDLSVFKLLTFSGVDQAIVANNSCANWKNGPGIQNARQLTAGDTSVVAFESISVFRTVNDARAAFQVNQNQLMCISGLPNASSEDVSSQVQICDSSAAAAAGFTESNGVSGVARIAEVRCGRAVTILQFLTVNNSQYNSIGDFTTLVSIAIRKVENLPGLKS